MSSDILDTIIILMLLLCAFEDIRRRIIPNSVVVLIVVIATAKWATTGSGNLSLSFLVAFSILLVGVVFFLRGVVGGGDAKLIPAATLMFLPHIVPIFLFAMAISGAVIALLFILSAKHLHRIAAHPSDANASFDPLRLSAQIDQGIPYGAAIFLGAVVVKIFGYE